jgi:hypothetical protein
MSGRVFASGWQSHSWKQKQWRNRGCRRLKSITSKDINGNIACCRHIHTFLHWTCFLLHVIPWYVKTNTRCWDRYLATDTARYSRTPPASPPQADWDHYRVPRCCRFRYNTATVLCIIQGLKWMNTIKHFPISVWSKPAKVTWTYFDGLLHVRSKQKIVNENHSSRSVRMTSSDVSNKQ